MALVNQVFNRNAFEAYAVLLNKGEHFAHGLALCAIGNAYMIPASQPTDKRICCRFFARNQGRGSLEIIV